MFGHHDRHGRHGFHAMRGGRHWGPFAFEWEMRDERGRGGGRRRIFAGDELRLLLLKLIESNPRHGYDLIREIEERTGGAYAPSPGVVYPTLTMLADMDLIAEQEADGAKKIFAITAAGEAYLAERAGEVEKLLARLSDIGEMRERGRRGPIKRAMVNLKQVLIHRLGEDEADADTMHAVAAIIDEAAQKIERL